MELKKYKKKRIVPQGWEEITLEDVFRTSSGATPLSTEVSYYANGTIPWINSGELDKPYIYNTMNFISQKGFENSSTEIYPIDTVLVAMYGATAGKASILKMEACTNQAVCAILPNKEYSSVFLKYSIDTLYDHLVGLSSGSARDNLSQTELKKLKLIMPVTKNEQENLVSILSLIDRKIELNRQINQNLEAMAKQLYDYWFVQFDFPDEKGKPYKSSGGEMLWNEKLKRFIPRGWESSTLGNECQMYQPKTLGLSELDEFAKYKVYGANGIIGKYHAYNHENSEIAMACRGNSCGTVNRTAPFSWITGNAMVIKMIDDSIHNEYIKQALRYANVEGAISGSGQPQLTRENLNSIKLCKPTRELIIRFSEQVSNIVEMYLQNESNIEELTKQRDELLPLLMNGQVSVNSDLTAILNTWIEK